MKVVDQEIDLAHVHRVHDINYLMRIIELTKRCETVDPFFNLLILLAILFCCTGQWYLCLQRDLQSLSGRFSNHLYSTRWPYERRQCMFFQLGTASSRPSTMPLSASVHRVIMSVSLERLTMKSSRASPMAFVCLITSVLRLLMLGIHPSLIRMD